MADYDDRRDVDRDPLRRAATDDPYRETTATRDPYRDTTTTTTTAYRETAASDNREPARHHHVGVGSKNILDWLAIILLIVGGLNWGLVGLFGFDLVAAIFGSGTTLARVIYIAVGVAAIWGFALMRLGPAHRH
jgi:uncharacterized protein